jgi:hypothetical protein
MAKGAYIYQQIELTTAEWAVNETVYPASVWLFERLENGKFNMKLSDGVHKFSELAAVLQDVVVEIVQEDESTYILRFATANGVFDTPNLRGQDVKVKVKTNTSSTYVLTITTVAGSFDTPNLKGGGLAEAPTLDGEPTPETLTYMDNTGVEVAFALGDEVRYYNAEEGEFIFFKLYDIRNGKAVWKEVYGGLVLPTDVILCSPVSLNENENIYLNNGILQK